VLPRKRKGEEKGHNLYSNARLSSPSHPPSFPLFHSDDFFPRVKEGRKEGKTVFQDLVRDFLSSLRALKERKVFFFPSLKNWEEESADIFQPRERSYEMQNYQSPRPCPTKLSGAKRARAQAALPDLPDLAAQDKYHRSRSPRLAA